MSLSPPQRKDCENHDFDFSGLKALRLNCTLKPGGSLSHTEKLMGVPEAIDRTAVRGIGQAQRSGPVRVLRTRRRLPLRSPQSRLSLIGPEPVVIDESKKSLHSTLDQLPMLL